MGDGLTEAFVRLVGAALERLGPPHVDYLAFYRAEVQTASSDGKTVDVQPENPRIKSRQGVKLLTGVPAGIAVVKKGTIVHLGWEGGDPAKPIAVPLFDAATVEKLTITADKIYMVPSDKVYLGGTSGTVAAAKAPTVQEWLTELKSKLESHTHTVPGTGTTCVNGSAWTGTATTNATSTTVTDKGSVAAANVEVK